MTDDPRIRLLNRLNARKRKELTENEKVKNVEVVEERMDKRSMDDLLSFINDGDGDSQCFRTIRNKNKNGRQKDQPRNTTSNNKNENREKDIDILNLDCHNGEIKDVSSSSRASMLQDSLSATFLSNLDFDDTDTHELMRKNIKP
ncbi:hypothetical protein POM88_000642 [Heracleum sosnowskyi]|uniref:Uncharacterized protein n=1 Tax=Heracleum sosnowskyi TaxID=360622 RepID=A0AAD8JEN6_9APIA|nr:hypothetical protein POM88_000642 [Heracleum sosnowskyi]